MTTQSTIFDTSLPPAGATFSDCRRYRYALWRIWDSQLPLVMFIGLNPSTANETQDDPTIRRVVRFARGWGYGGVYMTNLFAYATPYPARLKECADPLGDNDAHLKQIAAKCGDIIFAWGNFAEARERANIVSQMFPGAKVLVRNKDGTPRHPLYVPGNVTPVLY